MAQPRRSTTQERNSAKSVWWTSCGNVANICRQKNCLDSLAVPQFSPTKRGRHYIDRGEMHMRVSNGYSHRHFGINQSCVKSCGSQGRTQDDNWKAGARAINNS